MAETETRVCFRCEVTKPITEYYANKTGRRHTCKTCVYEGKLESVQRWNREHPDRVRELGARSRKRRDREWRTKALIALGGKCLRCDFTDVRALQIDHTNGGGTLERSMVDRVKFYQQVARGERTDVQLLCANCHRIKTVEAGEDIQ